MSTSQARTNGARTALVLLALVGSVLATYARVGVFEFVRYDDPDYVLDNAAVNHGLSWAGVRWAFVSAHASNWHPLTWLAHMLDVEFFGLDPAGHHWMSVGWHALNALLCFLALRALSGRFWPSAGVAFLFALHPLRVESVAWVSERKDVLSGACFFLLLLAYARYAKRPSFGRYAALLLCFALGLLAKPMLVTAPLVLCLLDLWPLGRLERAERADASARWRALRPMWVEKLPLFALALLSALATLKSQSQGGSLYTLEVLPLSERLANAPLALWRYLGHFFWPAHLAYFYPHRGFVAPAHATPWTVGAWTALAALLLVSAAVWFARRRQPALFVGWFWFLGMLVPVIGIVQVGEQALADRYAYLPLVGVQLALLFAGAELVERHARLARPLCVAGVAVLAACALQSARQTLTWRDSETLYRHALAVTDDNYPASVGLANVLAERGDGDGARRAYEEAIAIRPTYAPALYGLGLLEQEQGEAPQAIEHYRRACAAMPELAAAHLNMGGLLANQGELAPATREFERVLELAPGHPDAHFNLALLLLAGEHAEEALPHLEAALRVRPDNSAAWEKLGQANEILGRDAPAIRALEQAARAPERWSAASRLAWLLATTSAPELRDPVRALDWARRAVQTSQREDADALEALAAALAASGEFPRAAELQQEALARIPPERQASARGRLALYREQRVFLHEH